jgi:sarcosine oxidase subunit beta
MSNSYDAIVIGAGAMGASTALGLARKGLKPLAIDRLPAAGYGSTSGSSAVIRPFYSTVDGSAIAYESHFYWKDWANFLGVADERGLARYVDCGCLVMKTESNGMLVRALELMAEIDCPAEDMDQAALRARLPIIDQRCFGPAKRPEDKDFGLPTGGEVQGAVFFPTAGYVTDPQLAAHNMQRAAEANGAEFRFNCEVAEIRKSAGRIAGVTLADDTAIDAPVVVNAAGPHSAKVNAMAGVEEGMRIRTRALRQEVAHVPAPVGFDFEHDGMVISDPDVAVYCRPEHGNSMLLGSEDPDCDPREWVDPDNFDRSISDQMRIMTMRLAQRYPGLGIPNQSRGVAEMYDVSDDWIPVYDKSGVPGFYMAVGTSGNQFKNSPIVGELMAELIGACEAGRDHDRDPVRFRLKHTGREISIGFYSRLREINPESSFSVQG